MRLIAFGSFQNRNPRKGQCQPYTIRLDDTTRRVD